VGCNAEIEGKGVMPWIPCSHVRPGGWLFDMRMDPFDDVAGRRAVHAIMDEKVLPPFLLFRHYICFFSR
jgi:hypothetical protein